MAKALITGASGFVGPYLAKHLFSLGYEGVWGTSLSGKTSEDYEVIKLDIRDEKEVIRVIQEIAPDEIYHLAAISRPALGIVKEFYDVNLHGTINVLEAAKKINSKVLVVSSAYVYGRYDSIITEKLPLKPVNHYGASKAAADLTTVGYALEGLHVVRVRPFNHTGPKQSPDFVIPSLVNQLAQIEAGKIPPLFKLGNLDSVRDFCDVRDIVKAYPLLLNKGKSGEAYNACSGKGISISDLVKEVMKVSDTSIELKIEPTRVRATDIPFLVGDFSQLANFGWQPEINIQNTLQDMLIAEQKTTEHIKKD